MHWTSPVDPSGIAKIYYKFYQPPSQASDFSGSAGGNPPISLEFDEEGYTPIYFWLEDGAGNSNYLNYASAVIKYDGNIPEIQSSIISNAVYDNKWINPDSSKSAQIRVTYTENYPDSIRLFFGGTVVNEQPEVLPSGENQEIDFLRK